MRHIIRGLFLPAVVLGLACGSGEPAPPAPATRGLRQSVARDAPDASRKRALDALVQPLIDGEWLMGASIALVSGSTLETHGYGTLYADGPAVDERTIFEVGSVTKTFTSLLLADLVREGRVELEQPVASLLPSSVRVPELNGRAITLLDLSTHTSGLPRLPTNLLLETPEQLADPYANYRVSDLYAFLSSYELTVEPGSRFEYSNAAVGLLGHALTLAAGASYADAIECRITAPLGLVDTRPEPAPDQARRVATGHDEDLEPAPAWRHTPANEGSGSLTSTARDLGRYILAELDAAALGAAERDGGPREHARAASRPILASMALTQAPRRATDTRVEVGLAWFFAGPDILWHNGASAGQSAIVIIDRARRLGVAVLSNTASDYTDALGFALHDVLAGGEAQPLPLPPNVQLDAGALERFVGAYSLSAGAGAAGDAGTSDAGTSDAGTSDAGAGADTELVISRDGARLYGEIAGTRFRLFATSPTALTWRSAAATFTFEPSGVSRFDRGLLEYEGQQYVVTRH